MNYIFLTFNCRRNLIIRILLPFILLTCPLFVAAQDSIRYKQVDNIDLYLRIVAPADVETSRSLPAMIFFFGGGWERGTPSQFHHQALYYAERGMICFLANYRTASNSGTTPFESLKDARSALRFLRSHARELNIDPDRIVAAGASAGGQLAAALAMTTSYNEGTDDLTVSCKPDALVLFNPVIDNGPGGYGYNLIGEEYKEFSPLHNIHEGVPPTIILLGTKDKLVPVETAEYCKAIINKLGGRCELKLYEGQGHGFFNYGNREYYTKTLEETDHFLESLGYLKKNPDIK